MTTTMLAFYLGAWGLWDAAAGSTSDAWFAAGCFLIGLVALKAVRR